MAEFEGFEGDAHESTKVESKQTPKIKVWGNNGFIVAGHRHIRFQLGGGRGGVRHKIPDKGGWSRISPVVLKTSNLRVCLSKAGVHVSVCPH